YKEEIMSFLMASLGAESVKVLSSSIRKRDVQFPKYTTWGTAGENQPIQGVHVDFTPKYAHQRLEMELGKEGAARISGRRIQVLNIWHPLVGPVRDWPLGLLDYQSLEPSSDLIASDAIYPHYVAETYNVFHNAKHRWYYLSDQMPSEVFVFKSSDTKKGAAKGTVIAFYTGVWLFVMNLSLTAAMTVCAHASFDLGLQVQKPRESVDTIVLAVYLEEKAK
ncbi:hypothetical protein QBC46DRAFT_265930, partial [Diplogelasinospora grovesii]